MSAAKPLSPDRLFSREDWERRQREQPRPMLPEILKPLEECLTWCGECADVGDAQDGVGALWLCLRRLEERWLVLFTPEDADLLPRFVETMQTYVDWLEREDTGRPELVRSIGERVRQLRGALWWSGEA